jgi:hypothetical protein
MSREQKYYDEVRNANERLWDAINTLVSLQREWHALDYANTLDPGAGPHEGLTKTEISAVVNDTANAMVTLLNAGHATNMAKLLA